MNATPTNRRHKTAADYAVIAVAPILVCLMIGSLVSFLMLTIYRGPFPGNVRWIIGFFTMGCVAIARVAIEQDRFKANAYLVALGGATFFVITRFIGNPLIALVIIAAVIWLADVIVRDCTVVDDSVDASDRGLLQGDSPAPVPAASNTKAGADLPDAENASINQPKRQRGHRPGRTVLFLSAAALPFFGLGQFLIRGASGVWGSAQNYLAVYLFAALSLLVTTSFVALRRYLRQRGAEMPNNVSIAWLGGGLASVALILVLASMAPVPGRLIASIEPPDFLNERDDWRSSRYGFGDEAAKDDRSESAKVSDPNAPGESDGTAKGAPKIGGTQGNRQQGSPGNQSGGKSAASQSKSGQSKSGQSKSGQSKSGQSSTGSQSKDSGGSDGQRNGEQPERSNAASDRSQNSGKPSGGRKSASDGESKAGENQNAEGSRGDQAADNQKTGNQKTGNQKTGDGKNGGGKNGGDENGRGGNNDTKNDPSNASDRNNPSNGEPQQSSAENRGSTASGDTDQSDTDQSDANSGRGDGEDRSSSDRERSESSQSSESSMPSATSILAGGLSILRWIILAGCVGFVAFYVYRNWDAITAWFESLFNRGANGEPVTVNSAKIANPADPPPPFRSFTNPFRDGSDSRRVILISFAALEAFAGERGTRRGADETPAEFAARIRRSIPRLTAAAPLIDAFNRLTYANQKTPTDADLHAAKQLWGQMR